MIAYFYCLLDCLLVNIELRPIFSAVSINLFAVIIVLFFKTRYQFRSIIRNLKKKKQIRVSNFLIFMHRIICATYLICLLGHSYRTNCISGDHAKVKRLLFSVQETRNHSINMTPTMMLIDLVQQPTCLHSMLSVILLFCSSNHIAVSFPFV